MSLRYLYYGHVYIVMIHKLHLHVQTSDTVWAGNFRGVLIFVVTPAATKINDCTHKIRWAWPTAWLHWPAS